MKALPKNLPRAKLVELINTTENPRDKLLFLFGGTMGLRVSEAVKAKVEQSDSKERVFTVINGKTGDRKIPIPEFTVDYLDWYISHFELQPQDYIFAIRTYQSKIHIDDKPITRHHATRLCEKHGKRIGVKLHFHMLRHTYVTILLERGVDPITIKENCGWSDLRMLDIYAHLVVEQRRKKTDVAFNFLDSKPKCQRQKNLYCQMPFLQNPTLTGLENMAYGAY